MEKMTRPRLPLPVLVLVLVALYAGVCPKPQLPLAQQAMVAIQAAHVLYTETSDWARDELANHRMERPRYDKIEAAANKLARAKAMLYDAVKLYLDASALDPAASDADVRMRLTDVEVATVNVNAVKGEP